MPEDAIEPRTNDPNAPPPSASASARAEASNLNQVRRVRKVQVRLRPHTADDPSIDWLELPTVHLNWNPYTTGDGTEKSLEAKPDSHADETHYEQMILNAIDAVARSVAFLVPHSFQAAVGWMMDFLMSEDAETKFMFEQLGRLIVAMVLGFLLGAAFTAATILMAKLLKRVRSHVCAKSTREELYLRRWQRRNQHPIILGSSEDDGRLPLLPIALVHTGANTDSDGDLIGA